MSDRRRGATAAVVALIVLAVAPVRGRAQAPASTLLRHSDVGAFVPATCRVRLSMQQDNMPVSEVEIFRGGANRTLVRFLDPKERGKYLLRLGADLWFISPSAKNPVHLSPSHRIYGAATLDVLLGMHLSDDYEIAGSSARPSPAGPLTVFELQAASADQQFPSVQYTVNTATERPVSALYRLKSGRDATRIDFFDWIGSGAGQRYAKRIEVHDLLRKDQVTKIEAIAFEERPVADGLFDLHDGSARLALEKSGR
jgi:hypothetical protein